MLGENRGAILGLSDRLLELGNYEKAVARGTNMSGAGWYYYEDWSKDATPPQRYFPPCWNLMSHEIYHWLLNTKENYVGGGIGSDPSLPPTPEHFKIIQNNYTNNGFHHR
jgi:hypothetical protein